MQSISRTKLIFAVSALVIVSISRFLPHWPNFTALGATALFSGAVLYKNRFLSILLPLTILFASDLIINNVVYASFYESFKWITPGAAYIYGGIIAMTLLGEVFAKNQKITGILGAVGAGTIAFFLLTNFGAWLANPIYPKTASGLLASYSAGLPFLANAATANLVYSGILFGTLFLAKSKVPELREVRVKSK